MQVFVRRSLVPADRQPSGPALLLEGSWESDAPQHWALDDVIVAPEFEALDVAAQQLAERIIAAAAVRNPGGPNFADVNVLRLRYAAVKWLRILAFAERFLPAATQSVELFAGGESDDEYRAAWQALAAARRFPLHVHDAPTTAAPEVASAAPSPWWRRVPAALFADRREALKPGGTRAPRLLFIGNPRLLDGICDEALRRGVAVAWLYDQFPVRAWWKRFGQGVRWLTCRGDDQADLYPERLLAADVAERGVLLNDVVEAWYRATKLRSGAIQSRQWSRLVAHFGRRSFSQLVLDEDATPLARMVVALARRHGVGSWVAQHGVCGVRFGFVPLYADGFFAWDEGSRRQLEAWGESTGNVVVTGSTYHDEFLAEVAHARAKCSPAAPVGRKRVMLAAVPAPRDERPDAINFHLTTRTYGEMLAAACDAVAAIPGAQLIVKLHPRAKGCDRPLLEALRRNAALNFRIVQKQTLGEVLPEIDCVISCASSAGVDAAAAGVPVVQVLPHGSGDVVPAQWYGLLGSARTAAELRPLLEQALASPPAEERGRAASTGSAAARIVDCLLRESKRER